MRVAVIIVAAGKGARAGGGQPKQFVDLGGGETMISRCLDTFAASGAVDDIILALPAEQVDRVPAREGVIVVAGGSRRQDSTSNAFARVPAAADVVLIHDAARPFVSARLIERTIDAAWTHGAAIAALPARDTVKRGVLRDGQWVVDATLPREQIFLAQTPQAFRREVLARALAGAHGSEATDEAMLAEGLGETVHLVTGDEDNGKVTTAADLRRLRAGTGNTHAGLRIGTGYDLHRLVEGRPLMLAGVHVPFDRGLLGHSDADIVCHAVIDAVLGAAALGDVGQLFPDDQARWKDADSIGLLTAAVARVHASGWVVVNVDVTVVAERPKLLPYVLDMRRNLAAALRVAVSAVSLKGKTNEHMDATGREEAMACHAVALLQRGAPGALNDERHS